MTVFNYTLSYASTPFVEDRAQELPRPEGAPKTRPVGLPDLWDEVERLLPSHYLSDVQNEPLSSRLQTLAHRKTPDLSNPQVKLGDYYYPPTASRTSVFRGLATSAMVKVMLAATVGRRSATFLLKCAPVSPDNLTGDTTGYSVSTSLYMLPPRPLMEHGAGKDGLFLVTLVDERYLWRDLTAALRITPYTEWSDLASQLATSLNVTITFDSAVEAVYGRPCSDSAFFSDSASVPALLDAIGHNTGRVLVREYDGTYTYLTHAESLARVQANRGDASRITRMAGGDLFYSGKQLPTGTLARAPELILPATVQVDFPKYIEGPDPVPHSLQPRGQGPHPSTWREYTPEAYSLSVPLTSSTLTGVSGAGSVTLTTDAKALYSGELQANPTNLSGLTALGMKLAQNHWNSLALAALDELYPGTFAWTPEGFHSLIFTYSARRGFAGLRVIREVWQDYPRTFQHGGGYLSGHTNTPQGIGGPTPAQSWYDNYSAAPSTTLALPLASGDHVAQLADSDFLPTDQRWRGVIAGETILFEGTSGIAFSGGFQVGIVRRGIGGTIQAPQVSGATVTLLSPGTQHGVNSVNVSRGQNIFPGALTSGGIQEIVLRPQVQTVQVLTGSGVTIKGRTYYSGAISDPTPSLNSAQFTNLGTCWVVERNSASLSSGSRYGGQFGGFSASGATAAVYWVDNSTAGGTFSGAVSGAGINTLLDGVNHTDTVSQTPFPGSVVVGNTVSGKWSAISGGSGGAQLTITDGLTQAVGWATPNLLSTAHGDTVAGSPLKGSLPVGNSGNKWESFPNGISGQALVTAPDSADGLAWQYVAYSGAGVNKLLDGQNHTDTTNSDPARGSIVAGKQTNQWTDFPAGASSSGLFLQSDPTATVGLAWASPNFNHNLLDGSIHTDTRSGAPRLTSLVVGDANKWREFNGSGVASGWVLSINPSGIVGVNWAAPPAGTFSGAASGAGINQLLDGANHTDTFSGAAAKGVLIVGNSGALWQRFTVGNSGQVLTLNPDNNQGVNWVTPFSGGTQNKLLDGVNHTDTVNSSPLSKADLIAVNSGGKWQQLSAAGFLSGQVLTLNDAAGNNQGVTWVSPAAVPSAATQSDQETATSTTTYVSPGRQQYHPSASKGWIKFSGDGTTTLASYNVSSLTDSGTGDWTVNWNVDFSSANYDVHATASFTSGTTSFFIAAVDEASSGVAAGSTRIRVVSAAFAFADPTNVFVCAHGDQ